MRTSGQILMMVCALPFAIIVGLWLLDVCGRVADDIAEWRDTR